MRKRKIYKADKIILILVFGLAIYIPFLVGVIQQDKASSGVEKRNLAILPAFPQSIEELKKYPTEFNLYYSDHFGLRERLTRRYFKLLSSLGSQSSVEHVTTGKDDWLFLGSIKPGYTGYGDPMGDAINVNLFSQIELEQFASSITAIKNWLNDRGIEYIYVIAPNKHTIYFDKLPDHISKQNDFSATDQLVNYLRTNTDVSVIDLRSALLEEKNNQQVYHKSDTHWNHYGANVAQFKIMDKINEIFPGKISPVFLTPEQFKISEKTNGDLAKLTHMEEFKEDAPYPIFKDSCTPIQEKTSKESNSYITSCDDKELNTVVFGDSFFLTLKPYFSRNFNRFVYVPEKINHKSLSNFIEKNKPDIVIDEIVERELPYIPSSSHF